LPTREKTVTEYKTSFAVDSEQKSSNCLGGKLRWGDQDHEGKNKMVEASQRNTSTIWTPVNRFEPQLYHLPDSQFNHSVPQFPHSCNGDYDSSYFFGLY
jgi:hypothetical protein